VVDQLVQRFDVARHRLTTMHPAAMVSTLGALLFAILFGYLGVRHHRNFGTWSYDMAIYDQGFWLVSRGESFMTVRGLDFWGHHLNLVVLPFVPLYWLGAGPTTLYVVQAAALGAGAIPVYLIARDRFAAPWLGAIFAFSYLMYAPMQWISWANFHPEALVVTPMLFAWWFASRRSWRWFWVAVIVALSTREDTALAMIMLGLVLVVRNLFDRHRRGQIMGALTAALGATWYLLSTRLVIPAFNGWAQPFYIEYFYGTYGRSMPEIIGNIIKRPDRVLKDATQRDRLTFYRDLLTSLGGLPLLAAGPLLILAPQMVASVIGLSPYARQIKWQYTSVMIAPLIIASIEGAWLLWRFRLARLVLPAYVLIVALLGNIALSPSPLSRHNYLSVWAGANGPNTRLATLDAAVALVPPDAAVTATYTILPHLAHRQQAYDWPNPFVPAYWGNDDCDRLPSPTVIDFIVVDQAAVGEADRAMFTAMIAPGGPFEVLLNADGIVVGRRVGTAAEVDAVPQQMRCTVLESR
jgi:uncharacterized membrane protein